ncbi:aminopeptidase N [Parasynechococcus marenigrum]|uniref:Aminopeptidase N n=1 Tax=Parasynechococcus marenigrum (strain WH8102) TaxID=84588 RepID=Q7U868_PARMW|nr:aminopeptidase N [Parasynechococcus marenigrum]CAE07271.1 probable aminopeptidase N [Parasynechococcus marenigrum WH 8102]
MVSAAPVRLADYSPWPFALPAIHLAVDIRPGDVLVTSRLDLEPRGGAEALQLRGVDLEICSIKLNGDDVAGDDYSYRDQLLTIHSPPSKPFVLETCCRIDPYNNSSLEGLYVSGGLLSTQCEAEGFRRITFHPDRPDVLSRWTVRIEASRASCPVLLSNGNAISEEELTDGRHAVTWKDPFPKPSYLFALVAGELREIRDLYTTASGRAVTLRLHVEEGDEPYSTHAMESLKRSMAWDEQVYQLEYDLDEYNIVAVRHFNMGAMENKSLNIFNSKLVLADAETATDAELERIESVIAHEYFHNWSGNRITCRDWFQLSLKEGLTVFRDQSFTADLHSAAVKRIEDVAMLRNTQFREDAGPTAHPVKPAEYQAIDNFYTTTIYEKGAELIRMLHTLLGQERFMRGMATYVSRFDGTAATTEDFVQSIVDGAAQDGQPLGFDSERFKRWYHQAGTPELTVQRQWDAVKGELTLELRQSTPPTPGQTEKQPLVLPIAVALVGEKGRIGEEQLLVMDGDQASLTLQGDPGSAAPALSLLRRFSAPVNVQLEQSLQESLQLLAHDDDPFSRWDAGQRLARQVLLARASGEPDATVEAALIQALRQRLNAFDGGGGQDLAVLLALPGTAELEALQNPVDPPALYAARREWIAELGRQLADPLNQLLDVCRGEWPQAWPAGQGGRSLTGLAWSWLAAAGDAEARNQALEAVSGPSMTLARAALRALQPMEVDERDLALDRFYQRWQDKPVILDAWFALEASAPRTDGLQRVQALLEHPRFDPLAPNSLRAVLGGFTANVPVFHAIDGSGYRFMADQIAAVDRRNPITASRMAKVFSRWSSYGVDRQSAMRQAIDQLAAGELSSNTAEVVAMLRT